MVSRPSLRKNTGNNKRARAVRSILCGEVMQPAHALLASDSMARVLDVLTKHNWDHVFIVDEDEVPLGRIHAVDVLKMVSRKAVNRDIAWMHTVPAQQMLTNPPLTVRTGTPLLKAGALMLTHDLNQLAVVDSEGALVGVVGHSTVARVLPRFVL
jgi:CBS-domain-containing membrane protein